MMSFQRILFSILVAVPLVSGAQSTPGYLGKRLAISYQANMFPSLVNPTTPTDEINAELFGSVGLNYQHHLITEFVLTKQRSLVGDITYSTNYFDPGTGLDRLNTWPQMRALGFVLASRKYQQHFAPLGNYTELRVGYANVAVEDLNYTLEDEKIQITGGSGNTFIVGYAIGTNRIYRDQFMFSFAFEINYVYGWSDSHNLVDFGSSDFYYDDGNSKSNQEALVSRGIGRFGIETMFNFRLGVGYLP